jgi:hypothetical protein
LNQGFAGLTAAKDMTMQRRNGILLGLVALGLFAGCGGGGGMGNGGSMDGGGGLGGSGGSGGIPLSALPGKLADSLCAAYQNCYGPIFAVFLNGADCSTVTLQRIQNGSFPLLQGKIDQGKIRYDGSKAQACLDSLKRPHVRNHA